MQNAAVAGAFETWAQLVAARWAVAKLVARMANIQLHRALRSWVDYVGDGYLEREETERQELLQSVQREVQEQKDATIKVSSKAPPFCRASTSRIVSSKTVPFLAVCPSVCLSLNEQERRQAPDVQGAGQVLQPLEAPHGRAEDLPPPGRPGPQALPQTRARCAPEQGSAVFPRAPTIECCLRQCLSLRSVCLSVLSRRL
eukprot:SAG22_NODE_886_length_6665_cov_3.040359_2_plen_200_part_00